MIPENINQSLKSVCKQTWLFAYPVKDSRGILSEESHTGSEAGNHFPIIPCDKNTSVAFLFFMQNGDVSIVPDDAPREFRASCHSVKRFIDFICEQIRPSGAKDSGARFSNVTSAFTLVMFGLPRAQHAQIVEDPTELLDYRIPQPEKSSSGALDPSSAASIRSKKVHKAISVGDFARLYKGECLSDATIDFYSSWLRQTHPDKSRGIYFASSFFFKKLWSQLKDRNDRTNFSYMHKWNSIDFFSFNMVMFPANFNYRWSLIILKHPVALLQPKGSGRCRLLYPDSLRIWGSQIS
jgi:hypothetical protein